MGNALVIKNVDFEDNRVAVVTFTDVACTGITLSASTLVVTSRDGNILTYTVTPQNTTDSVQWFSSDETVVGIVNGAMVIVGVGSCVVTARCGKKKATCTVTVDLYEDPHLEIGYFNVVNASSGGTNNLIVFSGGGSKICCCAPTNADNGFSTVMTRVSQNQYFSQTSDVSGIRLPYNAKYIRFKGKYIYRANESGINIFFINGNATESRSGYDTHIGYKIVQSRWIKPPASLVADAYIEIPEGANGYVASYSLTPSTIVTGATYSDYSDLEDIFEDTVEGSIHYYSALPSGATTYTEDLA